LAEDLTECLTVGEDALIRFTVEQRPDQRRVLILVFAANGGAVELELEDPTPLLAATELLVGVLVPPLEIADARSDQLEGYPTKLSFSSDRGSFDVWARRIVKRSH